MSKIVQICTISEDSLPSAMSQATEIAEMVKIFTISELAGHGNHQVLSHNGHTEAVPLNGHGGDRRNGQDYNHNVDTPSTQGTSADYLTARIARYFFREFRFS